MLGHELSHVANGDMVTLTLIQGVVNTFVVFFARVIGTIVDKTVFRTERGTGPGYWITVMVLQTGAGHAGVDDRRVVLALARVPRRCRQRAAAGHAAADGQRAAPAGRARGRRDAEGAQRLRHHRQGAA